jgi:hypothetical protein
MVPTEGFQFSLLKEKPPTTASASLKFFNCWYDAYNENRSVCKCKR